MTKSSERWNKFDLAVYVMILALGALQFAMVRRANDYLNDTNYYELFKSIVNHAEYGFNGKPMTQLPPGLPYLMALLSLVIGSSYAAMLRVMTVFTTLALIASYELLRSRQDRAVAAICCVLLGSAPFLFAFSTSLVFADMPYFFASTLLLCIATNLDEASVWQRRQTLLWLLWSTLLVATVLIKSVGIALLGGLICWLAASYVKDRETGQRRCKVFAPALIAGMALQAGWMHWAATHQVYEWPVAGYQEHYLAQLRLKNANNPELGLADWKDVLVRPLAVADDNAAALVGLFTHKQMASAWHSPGTLIPLILVLLGLGYSFRQTGGGVMEWYFINYQAMFLLWPWDFELRFLLPVAPLAFLYAWRGGSVVWWAVSRHPRLIGAAGLALAAGGCLSSVIWGRHVVRPQMLWCVLIWLSLAGPSTGLLWLRREWIERLIHLFRRPLPFKGRAVPFWQYVAVATVGFASLVGVASQVRVGIANLDTDLSKDDFNYPEIEAALWVKAHSTSSSVVMARKDDMVYHYSQHRVIWFPPSRDTAMLMDGIRRHHVQYVIVHYGNDSYWRPSAGECFDALSRSYPHAFRLAHAGPHNSVFEVSQDIAAEHLASASH